jgi:RHS repeat-associated protein
MGAEPTSTTVSDPLGMVTTTTQDPLRDLPESKTDPAGYVSTEQYDALGRLTAVYEPGEPAGNPSVNPPNLKYTYTVSNTGPSVVDSYALNDDASYRVSETLYDALLRARETQKQTPDNGRTIVDTIYNTDGLISESTDPYFNSSAVAPTYVQAQAGDVPSATGLAYDGAGRKVTSTAYALGTQTWQTTHAYGGNSVTTVPPTGGTATTTITDARGRTTDLYQYHGAVTGDHSDTHYTYHSNGKQASVVDAAGNTWSYQYDLLGRQTSASDPDTGTSTSVYDNAGQLLSTTDGRGKQTAFVYDLDGRKTAAYDTTGGQAASPSNQIAAWTYDTVKKSYPTATTSFSAGDTYTRAILGYNAQAKPTAVRDSLTGEAAALVPAGGIVTGYGYDALTGNLTNESDPAVGGLPAENVQYGYDHFGEPTSVASATWTYVQAVGYSELGQPLRYTMPATGGNVWLSLAYDPQTRALTDAQTVASNSTTAVDDTSYRYASGTASAGAGLVTSTTDSQHGGATTDTQCFTYDYAQRLSVAWTATDSCTASPSPGQSTTVGGPTPYWQSWTYDAAGDRQTQTDHDPTGNTANDTTATYNYPAGGSPTDQPHTLTSTSATGPNSAQNTASYTYDATGNTSAISGGLTGNQSLTWTDQGKLASDTTSSGTTTYVYDASGSLLVRRDPGQTTVFIGGGQLVLNMSTGAVTGTRYYTISGQVIAARSSSGDVTYLIPDRQGTDQLTIDSSTYAVTRRQYLPFGQTRGTPSVTWPGADKGYVGGTPDPTTSLENLGAREYNPASGRFVSADPLLELADPTQMGGYDYSGNNPVTGSDPTGQMMNSCVDGCHDKGDPFGMPGGGVAEVGVGVVRPSPPPSAGGGDSGGPSDNNVVTIPTGIPNGPTTTQPPPTVAAPPEAVPDQNSNYETGPQTDPCASELVFYCIAYYMSPVSGVVDCVSQRTVRSCGMAAIGLLPGVKQIRGLKDLAKYINGVRDEERLVQGEMAAIRAAQVPTSSVSGVQLAQQLARSSVTSAFDTAGRLNPAIAASSTEIIAGADLKNTRVINGLTSDGSNIADWAKMKTPSIRIPGEGSFQVHFYQNRVTGMINYNYDYSIQFGR